MPAPGLTPAELKGQGPSRLASLPDNSAGRPASPADASQPAADVGQLVRTMASAPPVDAGRVGELKARIEGGAYRIDPSAIADAMLAAERSKG